MLSLRNGSRGRLLGAWGVFCHFTTGLRYERQCLYIVKSDIVKILAPGTTLEEARGPSSLLMLSNGNKLSYRKQIARKLRTRYVDGT